MSGILQDFRYTLRRLQKSPGFTALAVVTLALGIGATTAVFSLVDGILLRPLLFPRADRLVAIDSLEFPPGVASTNLAAANHIDTSYPNFFDWKKQQRTFESLASFDDAPRLFSRPDQEGARVLRAARVSANLFSTLGVAPALGRAFTADEEQPGHRVVILSHELWVSDFGSSPSAIGQTVKISDELSTIVGIMPAGFYYPTDDPVLFFTTYAADAEGSNPRIWHRDEDRLSIVGRLKPGVDSKQASADLNAIERGLTQQYSENRYRSGAALTPLLEYAVGGVRPALTLLLAAVGAVLLIGCSNVAGLLLARASQRKAELALRTALGAGRARIVRQLLVEATLLAAAGGISGIGLASLLLRIGLRSIPSGLPRLYSVEINSRVQVFAVLVSAATVSLCGLLPAWRSSQLAPVNALREAGHGITGGRRRSRLHHTLVVVETALGFVLLVASGLLIKSLLNRLRVPPGFDTQHTLSFDVALTNKRYPDPAKIPFFDKLLPQLAALPGVQSVGAGHPLPTHSASNGDSTPLTISGHLDSPNDPPTAVASAVIPGYFETLSIPLIRGRILTAHDNDPKAAPVALINQSFARRYFPSEDALGRYFTPQVAGPAVARQIVGIVGDTRTEDLQPPPQPQFFLPYAQDSNHQRPVVVMRVFGDPLSYENSVRRVVANIDKDPAVFGYHTFIDQINTESAQSRFDALLVSGFGAIALLLSAVGLYSVLSFVVSERSRELGLRMAFGATRSDLLRVVLKRGLAIAAIGILLGASVSIFAARWIADMLFNVAVLDGSVLFGVSAVLLVVSTVAALVPALRAAHLDPMVMLRNE
jgi:putative ABC transport system permease protein